MAPSPGLCFRPGPSAWHSGCSYCGRLAPEYPHYAAALAAATGGEYVDQVSITWSTDPERAANVLEICRAHANVFSQAA